MFDPLDTVGMGIGLNVANLACPFGGIVLVLKNGYAVEVVPTGRTISR